MLKIVLAAVGVASAVHAVDITSLTEAPFNWVFPPGRGYASDSTSVYPCGGISPGESRTAYPVTGSTIAFNSTYPIVNMDVLWVNQSDPELFHDFSTYTDSIIAMSVGEYCFAGPDFTSLGVETGENVTMLVIYELAGNKSAEYNYACADLTIVDENSFTESSFTCANSSVIIDIAPLNESMVLHGENFTGDQAREGNGETLSLTELPTTSATTNVAVFTEILGVLSTTTYAHGGAVGSSAASSAASSATSAASTSSSSSSSSSSALRRFDVVGVASMVAAVGVSAAFTLF
ncbi:hypothetical protein L202_01519 [Cryptococcus amylolentus CBS 6039]|uniref:Copper acquisition factor BIM1-like domain-containing protein n=2 Tax=Cryptococcus amylolentus TaxID=104669 RepID=A0A1E3I6A2_9TREE|nr:hypothetical protein L202_01519 [Cryptococcus amylolentus CBS 6039]ODN83366.1 hypothetical protein L202_01519 [Cryptococcus amylolentus CBS 6039]ODO10904.1 hypothetical protein I350_01503 [Cryptococcus amylolentus CBS 6273]